MGVKCETQCLVSSVPWSTACSTHTSLGHRWARLGGATSFFFVIFTCLKVSSCRSERSSRCSGNMSRQVAYTNGGYLRKRRPRASRHSIFEGQPLVVTSVLCLLRMFVHWLLFFLLCLYPYSHPYNVRLEYASLKAISMTHLRSCQAHCDSPLDLPTLSTVRVHRLCISFMNT